MGRFTGPAKGVPAGCTALAPGVWLTSGRAAVLEGTDHLALIDPGDEPCGSGHEPEGPLADLLTLQVVTGKPLAWVLVTHAHPDHVRNLPRLRALEGVRVLAHAASPVRPDVALRERGTLDIGTGIEAIPTPGHSSWGDDLSFWLPSSRLLFSADLVQPKGETWGETFYPSPYLHFRDGDRYVASLGLLAALPVATLVTGHREVRTGSGARAWIELSIRSVRRVAEAVAGRPAGEGFEEGARAVYRELARERGLPEDVIRARLARGSGGPSAFESYDLPGIAYYWERRTA